MVDSDQRDEALVTAMVRLSLAFPLQLTDEHYAVFREAFDQADRHWIEPQDILASVAIITAEKEDRYYPTPRQMIVAAEKARTKRTAALPRLTDQTADPTLTEDQLRLNGLLFRYMRYLIQNRTAATANVPDFRDYCLGQNTITEEEWEKLWQSNNQFVNARIKAMQEGGSAK